MLLRKRSFDLVACVMIITQKVVKKEENVEYMIVTRAITSCYIFRRKMIQQKGSGDGASGQDGPRSNQIKQGDGSGMKHYQLFRIITQK